MNLPTQLTVGRICLVPLVVVFLISTESIHALVAAVLFAGAALTDWLDGLIARRRGQVTTLGSRFPQKTCFTRAQLEEIQRRTDSMMDDMERGMSVCGSAETCGSN